MVEKSPKGIVEIFLHIVCVIICVGVLIACSAALSAIGDISFEHDIVETIGGASGEDDRDRFRDVAGWLLFAGIAGIISQITIVIIRALFYFEIIQNRYLTYAVLSNLFTLLLSVMLTAGGGVIAANAEDVQQYYIDGLNCDDTEVSQIHEQCDYLEELRDAQAGAAAAAFIASIACIVIALTVMVGAVTRRKESTAA